MSLAQTGTVALYDRVSAQSWLQRASNGTLVSALEHNSGLIAYAMLMDAISQPQLPNGSDRAAGSTRIFVSPYPEFVGKLVPIAGLYPRPDEALDSGRAQAEWDALEQFVIRITDGVRAVPGIANPPPNGSVPTAYLVMGTAADGIITRGELSETTSYREDPDTALKAAQLYAAAYAYADRLRRGLAGASAAIPLETALQPVVDRLRGERESERTKAKRYYVLGAVGAVAIAGISAVALK